MTGTLERKFRRGPNPAHALRVLVEHKLQENPQGLTARELCNMTRRKETCVRGTLCTLDAAGRIGKRVNAHGTYSYYLL